MHLSPKRIKTDLGSRDYGSIIFGNNQPTRHNLYETHPPFIPQPKQSVPADVLFWSGGAAVKPHNCLMVRFMRRHCESVQPEGSEFQTITHWVW